MLFSDLKKITGGHIKIHSDNEIAKFSTDTRTLSGSPDELFVAIKGSRDGHQFVREALKKGIQNFLVEKDEGIEGANLLIVDNSLKAFQKIAAYHRAQFKIPIIGITGSNGKTTVKEWLSSLLSQKYFVVKSPKSYNSQIGVPLSVHEMTSHHEIGVFEAGISTTGEMESLQEIIQPTLGIFTTLGAAHAEGFADDRVKLEEKLKLFRSCEKIICRNDTPWYDQLKEVLKHTKIISWSLAGDADYKVKWLDSKVVIGETIFDTSLRNEAELENITHAIVAGLNIGLSEEEITLGLSTLKSIPMRLELKRGINGCYILNDAYNNDLAGLKLAMDYFDRYQQNSGRIVILSDILQSGKPDNELYKEVASLVKEKGFNKLIGVGPRISASKEQFSNSEFYASTDELINNIPQFKDQMILVKGARDFALEKVVEQLEEKNHGTVLEVNFEALKHNLNSYRALLSSKTQLMVMVKANAYGGGLLEVASFLQHEGVDRLGVAYVDEAIQLRQNGISLPIMIMNPNIERFDQFERFQLEPEIFSLRYLERLLRDSKKPPPIHIKIDTGMHRLGFQAKQIDSLVDFLRVHNEIQVASVFTHFSSSEDPKQDVFTSQQAQAFEVIYNQIRESLGYFPLKHACNSSGIVRWSKYHYDMVRLGIGLHGYDPTGELKLRPASQLRTIISQIQDLAKGETVGYARKGKIERDSRIAVLPIGYEDGYLRVFGNGNGKVLINGHLCPTIGNICMDMTMVDVTDISASEGDTVTIFGNNPPIEDLADVANTIPYEILTNVSGRVKRIFISE